MKKLGILTSMIVMLFVASCATTSVNTSFVNKSDKALYPAIYQSFIDASEKFSKKNSEYAYFAKAKIAKVDIYNTSVDIENVSVPVGKSLFGGLFTKEEDIEKINFNLNISAKPLAPIQYYSKNEQGIARLAPAINFFNTNIEKIMASDVKYKDAQNKALSDPEFLIAILGNMTKLNQDLFLKEELSKVKAKVNIKISSAEKNPNRRNPLFAKYKYRIIAHYYPDERSFIGDSIMILYYTNDTNLPKLGKGTSYRIAGKFVEIFDRNTFYTLSIVE